MKNKQLTLSFLLIISTISILTISCKKTYLGTPSSTTEATRTQENDGPAKVSQAVSFSISAAVNETVLSGTCVGSGALVFSADYTEEYKWNGKYYHSEVTMSNSNGSITFNINAEMEFATTDHGTGTLTWKVKKATGEYSGITGNGTGVVDLSNWNPNTGTGIDVQNWVGDILF